MIYRAAVGFVTHIKVAHTHTLTHSRTLTHAHEHTHSLTSSADSALTLWEATLSPSEGKSSFNQLSV